MFFLFFNLIIYIFIERNINRLEYSQTNFLILFLLIKWQPAFQLFLPMSSILSKSSLCCNENNDESYKNVDEMK